MNATWVADHRADPRALENSHRQDPRAFKQALQEALGDQPDDLVLQAWDARLNPGASPTVPWKSLVPGLALAVATALALRLPALWLDEEWFYPRFAPLLVLLGLALHFWDREKSRPRLGALLALATFAVIHVALLPGEGDSVLLALAHLPLAAFAVVAFQFCGAKWRTVEARLDFVRYAGELLVLGCLMALGGGVFSALSIALFERINPAAPEWYATNIGVMGAAALPLLATLFHEKVLPRPTGAPALLARIFTPLFLAMVGIYLPFALLGGANPFTDRNFLFIVNGLLLVVTAMTVLSVAERGKAPWRVMDHLTMGLLGLCLLLDGLALSSILFRLASFGWTPNRVAVVGANVIVLGHVATLLKAHWNFHRSSTQGEVLGRAAALWLPVYGMWAAFVAFLLPLIFRYR
jgi:hypothetical protein